MDTATWISVIIGILGLSGLIFTALRYNRDDTTALVNQQATITNEMKVLNDELRQTAARLREERDALGQQVEQLTAQVQALEKHDGWH